MGKVTVDLLVGGESGGEEPVPDLTDGRGFEHGTGRRGDGEVRVGLHAVHVTAGLTVMLIVLGLALGRQVASVNRAGVGLVSWYWHFVDGVWVVVFTVVYLVGR